MTALLLLALALSAPAATPHSVALRWVDELARRGDAEARETARVALDLAGAAVVPGLLDRLREGGARGAAAAWALGVVLEPDPVQPAPAPVSVVEALRQALAAPDPATRLSAASTLGLLDVSEASADVAGVLLRRDLPAQAEPIVLMALAGTGGPGDSLLLGLLERGGGPAWAEAALAITLRRGAAAWPDLVHVLETSHEPTVRAVAATALLLLAEPDSACAMAEAYGRCPEPPLRRVLLQALAACRHPQGRDLLRHVAHAEADPSLREMAAALAGRPLDAPRRPRDAGRREVPELLREVAAGPGSDVRLEMLEARAAPRDAAAIGRALRRLPLRGDDEWLDDHARLAQLRARLRCLDGYRCD